MNSANFQDPRLKYKNLLHLYTLIKKYHKQKVFFFITPFKITLKRIKHLGVNLTREVKALSENYETLMQETEDEQRNGKISHAVGLEELILLKCPYFPKQSTDLMQSLPYTHAFFDRTRTKNPKIHTEPQKTPNCQSNLEKKKE